MSDLGAKWLKALASQKLEIVSARDALQIRGWLDTGNYALNWAVSGRFRRGYPLGRSVELFGDPGAGKSFLIARAIAKVQQQDGVAMVDDTEGAYVAEFLEKLEVDPNMLAYKRSHTVSEHVNVTKSFIAAYEGLGLQVPGVLACDSMALLTTDHERDSAFATQDMTKAKEVKKFFRLVSHELNKIPAVYLVANHVYDIIGGFGGQRESTSGKGAKYQATVRVDLRSLSKIKAGRNIIGVICHAVVAKNRVTAPYKEVYLSIPFHEPISAYSGLIPVLLQLGIIHTAGNFIEYEGKNTKIPVYKTKENFLKQDQSGEELVRSYPDILQQADEILASTSPGVYEDDASVDKEDIEDE